MFRTAGGAEGSQMIRVALVDDQTFVRFGLKSILRGQPDIEVVGEASTGHQALDLCRRVKPDMLVMDIEMPELDGIAATRRIKKEFPTVSILVFTAHDSLDYLTKAVEAGAAGYILKETAYHRLPDAVRRVMSGESPLDQELAMRLLQDVTHRSRQHGQSTLQRVANHERVGESLTEREREILALLALGMTNQQIAEELVLSMGTVKTHVHRIISKLGVSDRTQAAVLAIRLGLISPED
jgi:DNA-binding NarL/FixJ family response regulator